MKKTSLLPQLNAPVKRTNRVSAFIGYGKVSPSVSHCEACSNRCYHEAGSFAVRACMTGQCPECVEPWQFPSNPDDW